MPDREEYISSFSGTQIDSSVSKVLSDDVKDSVARSNIATLQAAVNGMSAVSLGAVPQYSSMPTAAAQWVDKIVQYVGSTASGLTNGYFYKCNQNGQNYTWGAIAVEPTAIDSAMSNSSTNPVQNMVIDAAIKAVAADLTTEVNARSTFEGTKGAANGIASLDGDTKVLPSQASARIITVSSSRTLALTDAGCFLNVNSTSNITITIPANASVAFPVGTEMEFCRYNTGTVTFAGASGVTISSANSIKTITPRYGTAGLKKVDSNKWLLTGNLG